MHDGRPIVESSLNLYYIDDVFPDPALMPKEPHLRHRVRMFNKLIDEYMHNACTILTFAMLSQDRSERISQIMTEHGNELVAQLRGFPFIHEAGFTLRQALDGTQVGRNQFGKQFEHADSFRRFQSRRPRVNGAKRAEELSVRQNDRHRYVALKAVHRRSGMPAIGLIFGNMVDHNRLAALTNFVADRGFDL